MENQNVLIMMITEMVIRICEMEIFARNELLSKTYIDEVKATLTPDINNDKEAVKVLFETLAGKYANRNGGYTRILKLDERRGDDALMVILELVEE